MGPCHDFPQGSVLGPLLYIIYTSKLGSLLTAHDVRGNLYTGDIQAYLHCLESNAMAAVPAMTLATGEAAGALVDWMSSNCLRLNPSTTQYIWMGTQQHVKLDLASIAASFPHIEFSVTVRDLGVTLDQELTFAPHINRLCRDCFYTSCMRQLRIISRSLTSTATATLVHEFVSARLD